MSLTWLITNYDHNFEKNENHEIDKGKGTIHDGSFRALKIEYDDKSEALDIFKPTFFASLPGFTQQL